MSKKTRETLNIIKARELADMGQVIEEMLKNWILTVDPYISTRAYWQLSDAQIAIAKVWKRMEKRSDIPSAKKAFEKAIHREIRKRRKWMQ